MEDKIPEFIHCWFSEKQQAGQENFTWFKMDDGSIKRVTETHVEHHGDPGFLTNHPDAEYVGVGQFSHIGTTEKPES